MMEENYSTAYISYVNSNVAHNSENILIPKKSSENAAGYDLYTTYDGIISPNCNRVINTGVKIKLPKGTYAKIEISNDLALKHLVAVNIIDSDYTGEWQVIVHNTSPNSFNYKKNMKIAQFIVLKHENINFKEVKDLDLIGRDENILIPKKIHKRQQLTSYILLVMILFLLLLLMGNFH